MNRVLLVPERLLGLGVSQCLLDRKSIRLRTARSAPEALSITSVWKPELIIASNDVGDTREGSATKFLRALRLRVPAGRIILISERLSFDDEEQISLVDVRLVEPLDERSFSETVASLLSSRGPQAERRASPMMAAVGRDPGSVAREVARIRNIGVTGCELEMQNAVPIGTSVPRTRSRRSTAMCSSTIMEWTRARSCRRRWRSCLATSEWSVQRHASVTRSIRATQSCRRNV
jgi:hypothetical protein